jgi:hypothetical protein
MLVIVTTVATTNEDRCLYSFYAADFADWPTFSSKLPAEMGRLAQGQASLRCSKGIP